MDQKLQITPQSVSNIGELDTRIAAATNFETNVDLSSVDIYRT